MRATLVAATFVAALSTGLVAQGAVQAPCFEPLFGTNLALGDDTVALAQPLGFAFPVPGGTTSTTTIGVSSNGFVWLDNSFDSGCCDGNESKFMSPGVACIACHQQQGGEAPSFSIAGTVYPTAHEPDNCNATVKSGPLLTTAIVEITDKNGGVHTLTVNSVGNFMLESAIAKPYTAKVVYDGRERVMVAAQTSGDCNACHTQDGTKDAPGRVLLP